jgi:hypothetical protein
VSSRGAVFPLLWNLVVDKLLVEASDLGLNILGYADDIVIIPHISDSQAALKSLSSPKVTSRLVAECLDAVSAGKLE